MSAPVEQVIDVLKIFLQDRIPQHTVLRSAQMAEQLVEVPTAPFFVEKTVDIPVPCGGGGGRLAIPQDFPSGHNPTACGSGCPQGFYAHNRVQQRFVVQNITTKTVFLGQRSTAFRGAEHHDQDGFLPRLRSTATVCGWLHGGRPQDFRTGQSSTGRRGGPQDFLAGQSSSSIGGACFFPGQGSTAPSGADLTPPPACL